MNKYHNKKIINEYGEFDSLKEYKYFLMIKQEQELGLIKNLRRQVKYVLLEKDRVEDKAIREISYYADFEYEDDNGNIHTVDVKASSKFQDDVYKLKKKLFASKYRRWIEEKY